MVSRIATWGAAVVVSGGAAVVALAAPRPQAVKSPPPAGFAIVEAVAGSGLDAFRHTFGDDQFSKILEDTGSGVALLDWNGDGRLDVFLSSGHFVEGLSDPAFRDRTSSGRSRLFENLGGLKFRDVTDEAGLAERGFGMGAVVGDYDGDGDDDLLVLNWGANVLYRNDVLSGSKGAGHHFTDVTAAAGVAGPATLNGQPKWSVNGCFFDFDGDGDLDLFVANYLAFDPAFKDPNLPKEYPYEGPESYRGQQSLLYRNEGDGTFKDVTAEAGLTLPDGKTMGASICDFDGDGDQDLFEAMDTSPSVLWRNDRGRFTNVASEAGVAFDPSGAPTASMHGTIGDLDGDGRFDLFVGDLGVGRCLLNATGGDAGKAAELRFDDRCAKLGVAGVLKGSGAWGSAIADFDDDGATDLLVVLGGAFDLHAGEHDRLFRGDGKGGLLGELSATLGASFQEKRVSRGAAFGDLDDDGDIDYVVNVKDVGAPPRLMRNDRIAGKASDATGHWLALKLVGAGRMKDAIGAVATLKAGGRTQVRFVQRASSYLSQCDPRLHFGLGGATKVDALEIRWPSGHVQKVAVDAIDRVTTIAEETAK